MCPVGTGRLDGGTAGQRAFDEEILSLRGSREIRMTARRPAERTSHFVDMFTSVIEGPSRKAEQQ